MFCHHFELPRDLRIWKIDRNMLKMAAILKSKMAAKREMISNFLSTFIAIHIIKNIGFATILSSLGSSEVEM